jgi:hypothetical protein
MNERINNLFERINDFLVRWPGALPLAGLALILVNFALQLFPGPGFWIVDVNLLLHLGLLISIIGLLLVNVYRS